MLDVGQLHIEDTENHGEQLSVTVPLVSATDLEAYLPKAFRERKRHKEHAQSQHVDTTKCMPATDLQDPSKLENMQQCGSISFTVLRTKVKQSVIQGNKFGDDDEEDVKHMSDPRDSKYNFIRRELMAMVQKDMDPSTEWCGHTQL